MKKGLLNILFAVIVCVVNAQTITTNSIPGSPFCSGTILNVTYTISGTYTGNTFTAQLSDAAGNFGAPTNIGSVGSNTPVSITATIPVGMPTGSNYKIRVISSSPPVTGSDNGSPLVINQTPASPSISSNSPVCSGKNLSLTASFISGASYNWNGPNSYVSSQQNPVITNINTNQAGTYSVTAMSNGCISPAGTKNVAVNETPSQPSVSSNSPVTTGSSLNLFANAVPNATAYNWSGPNSFTSSVQNPVISGVTMAAAGTYSVSAGSSAGCVGPIGVTTVTVSSSGSFPINLSKTDVTCNGFNNGSAATNPSGPNPPFKYSWSNGATTQSVSALYQGNYSVMVVDNINDTVYGSVNIMQPPPLNVTASSNSPLPSGDTLKLFAYSNDSSSVYSWTGPNGFSSSSQKPMIPHVVVAASGNYSVSAVNANGCGSNVATINVTINPSGAFPVTINKMDEACNGGNNASITATPAGGTSPYVYKWSPGGMTTSSITGLVAGNYSVMVIDNINDTAYAFVNIMQPSPLNVTASSNSPIPSGDTLRLFANSNNGSVTYSWTGPNSFSSSTQNPMIPHVVVAAAGNYSVTVTSTVGCGTSTVSTFVNINSSVAFPINLSKTDVTCNGFNNGSATTNPSGPNPPFKYSWSNGATTQAISALYQGNYSVMVVDNINDTVYGSVNIMQPPPLNITASNNSPIGSGDTLKLDANANDSSAVYSWTGPNGFTSSLKKPIIPNALMIAAGDYSVTAVNANGCNSNVAVTHAAINPSGAFPININKMDEACNGGNNASITASPAGGTSPYVYQWSPGGMTTASITGLIAGSYSVMVIDNVNDTAYAFVNIMQPPPFNVSASSNSPILSGDTLKLSANINDSSSVYSWSGPNGFTSSLHIPIIPHATAAAAGTYSVTAMGTNGCGSNLAITVVTINPPPSVTVTISTTSVTCNGGSDGSAMATASGGTGAFTYLWSNSAITQSITGLVQGNYSITVTDALGITASGVVSITQPAVVAAPVVGSNGPITAGQNLSLTASSVGTTYSWSGPNSYSSATQNPVIPNVTTAASGTYSVTATTAAGCISATGTTSVTVNSPCTPPTVVTSANATICAGTSVSISATVNGGVPAYTYQWSPTVSLNNFSISNPVASPSITTGYSVLVQDAAGCTNTGTVTIIVNATPSAPTAANNSPVVAGQTLSLTASNISSATYSWNGPNSYVSSNQNPTIPSVTTAASGTYSVSAMVNGCTSLAATTLVTINTPPPVSVTVSTVSVTCMGMSNGSANATATGGTGAFTYSWMPGGQVTSAISNQFGGSYTVTVTDAVGISASAVATILQPAMIVANISVVTPISCNGVCDGSAKANPTGGTSPYTYLWTPGNITAQSIGALCVGNYSLTITDAHGCNTNSTVSLVQPAVLKVSSVKTDLSCNGQCNGTATATPVGGTSPYSYYWNNGENIQTAIGLCAGKYNVALTDSRGCMVRDTIVVGEPLPVPITISTTPPTCGAINGSATAVVSGAGAIPPFRVLWNTGDTNFTINNLGAGIYRATVKDGNGCVSFSEALLNNSNGPVVTVNTVKDVSCFGLLDGSITISVAGSGPYKYKWSNGRTTQNISNLSYGPYEVVVSDASACSATKSVFVNQPSAPLSLTTSSIKSSCPGANGSTSVSVLGGTTPYSYHWSSGVNAATASGLSSANYSITVTDAHGCIISGMAAVSDSIGPVVVADTINAVDCGSTGFVALRPKDSTLIQSYQWNTGSTTQNLSNVTPGNYGVVVTDLSGCKSSLVVPVKPALPPLKPICLVTVDTLTHMNMIVWEKPISSFIDGFNIYRESSQNGIYQRVGYVPYSSLSTFYDSITDPNDRWAKYKISMNDVCGKEGPLSPEHKTIHFSIQSSTVTKTYLIWDNYIGSSFTQYNIYRKSKSSGIWTLIDSVPSTVTVYCDSLFPHLGDTIFYLVDVPHIGGNCVATKRGSGMNILATTVKSSKSNSSDRKASIITSVDDKDFDKTMVIFPNPSNGIFTVQSARSKIQSVDVYNVLGEMVYQTIVNNLHKTEITIPDITSGIYQVHITTDKGKTNTKMIVAR